MNRQMQQRSLQMSRRFPALVNPSTSDSESSSSDSDEDQLYRARSSSTLIKSSSSGSTFEQLRKRRNVVTTQLNRKTFRGRTPVVSTLLNRTTFRGRPPIHPAPTPAAPATAGESSNLIPQLKEAMNWVEERLMARTSAKNSERENHELEHLLEIFSRYDAILDHLVTKNKDLRNGNGHLPHTHSASSYETTEILNLLDDLKAYRQDIMKRDSKGGREKIINLEEDQSESPPETDSSVAGDPDLYTHNNSRKPPRFQHQRINKIPDRAFHRRSTTRSSSTGILNDNSLRLRPPFHAPSLSASESDDSSYPCILSSSNPAPIIDLNHQEASQHNSIPARVPRQLNPSNPRPPPGAVNLRTNFRKEPPRHPSAAIRHQTHYQTTRSSPTKSVVIDLTQVRESLLGKNDSKKRSDRKNMIQELRRRREAALAGRPSNHGESSSRRLSTKTPGPNHLVQTQRESLSARGSKPFSRRLSTKTPGPNHLVQTQRDNLSARESRDITQRENSRARESGVRTQRENLRAREPERRVKFTEKLAGLKQRDSRGTFQYASSNGQYQQQRALSNAQNEELGDINKSISKSSSWMSSFLLEIEETPTISPIRHRDSADEQIGPERQSLLRDNPRHFLPPTQVQLYGDDGVVANSNNTQKYQPRSTNHRSPLPTINRRDPTPTRRGNDTSSLSSDCSNSSSLAPSEKARQLRTFVEKVYEDSQGLQVSQDILKDDLIRVKERFMKHRDLLNRAEAMMHPHIAVSRSYNADDSQSEQLYPQGAPPLRTPPSIIDLSNISNLELELEYQPSGISCSQMSTCPQPQMKQTSPEGHETAAHQVKEPAIERPMNESRVFEPAMIPTTGTPLQAETRDESARGGVEGRDTRPRARIEESPSEPDRAARDLNREEPAPEQLDWKDPDLVTDLDQLVGNGSYDAGGIEVTHTGHRRKTRGGVEGKGTRPRARIEELPDEPNRIARDPSREEAAPEQPDCKDADMVANLQQRGNASHDMEGIEITHTAHRRQARGGVQESGTRHQARKEEFADEENCRARDPNREEASPKQLDCEDANVVIDLQQLGDASYDIGGIEVTHTRHRRQINTSCKTGNTGVISTDPSWVTRGGNEDDSSDFGEEMGKFLDEELDKPIVWQRSDTILTAGSQEIIHPPRSLMRMMPSQLEDDDDSDDNDDSSCRAVDNRYKNRSSSSSHTSKNRESRTPDTSGWKAVSQGANHCSNFVGASMAHIRAGDSTGLTRACHFHNQIPTPKFGGDDCAMKFSTGWNEQCQNPPLPTGELVDLGSRST